ncbi:deacetylase Oant_2987-like [Mytilus galloprovincialis]|uniref:deacetylase Oant_2987-like n=1 Tax=Mytilus galloprovincialis TaxID=29158 RepID=UPI003F7B8267
MTQADILIRNGRIIDPANGFDFTGSVAVSNGVIKAVGENLNIQAVKEFDATDCLITPGLIDCHVHCYEHATPLGVNPDETCLSRGVTTVVDAGSSGESTFPGLRKFIAEKSHTRVLCFLHIVQHGLASSGCAAGVSGGEIDSLNQVDVDACVKCIENNRDMIVGVKVRLSETISNGGKNEEEAFRRSLEASQRVGLPLMVHHTISTIPTQSDERSSILCCPRDLRPGDIYTHTFIGHKSTIIDASTRSVYPDVIDAKQRGVLFDVGHGQKAFSWPVAEICAKSGFWPDIIGSDLHTGNHDGPVYDLPTVMSKFLHIGMPITEIVKATTLTPARAIKLQNSIGSLTTGKSADITVLKIIDVDHDLEDGRSQNRRIKKVIVPIAVWKDGEQFQITKPRVFPNPEVLARNAPTMNNDIIRDLISF